MSLVLLFNQGGAGPGPTPLPYMNYFGNYFGNNVSAPVFLALTVTDDGDGTGATATISGSSGGANTIYTQQVVLTGGVPPGFVQSGVRGGDGTAALNLPPGYYWAYCATVGGNFFGESNLAYFAVTNGQSVATRLQDAICARLSGLIMYGVLGQTSPGAPNNLIQENINENEKLLMFPCLTVCYAGDQETEKSELTGRDDVVYPFRVRIIDRAHPDDSSHRALYQQWKQQVMRALRNQRFTTVPESLINKVVPGKNQYLSGPQGWTLFCMDVIVQCAAREPRG